MLKEYNPEVSIDNLHEKTAQEVFDFIARHLLTQKVKSIAGISCKYYVGGLRCAAGCLIPSSKYDPRIELGLWTHLIKAEVVPSTQHDDLILSLQTVHDQYYVESWPSSLREQAKNYNLSDSVINEFELVETNSQFISK